MKCFSASVSRARPLLGTRVEITARGERESELHRAADAAFAAVAQVHRLMSFQAPDSDVSRLNREACCRPVSVDPETWHVLDRALALSASTGGIFDVTASCCAPSPAWNGRQVSFRDIELMSAQRVRFRRALSVDLGGIAKGYAVDRAVDCLVQMGVEAGVVNAGGDLRAFGEAEAVVEVRDPGHPARSAAIARIRDAALATTARYPQRWDGSVAGTVVDPRRPRAGRAVRSATVRAGSCLVADGLAKSLYLLGPQAGPALARHGASGFLLDDVGLCKVGA